MKRFKILSTIGIACAFLFSSCGGGEEKTSTTAATADSTVAPASAATTETPASTIDTTPQTRMLVRHKVDDFEKWKASYDAHDSLRLASGMHSYVIGRGADDANMVLVAVKADDVDKAKAFVKGGGFKAAMKQSGVSGPPSIMLIKNLYLDNTPEMSDMRALINFKVKDWNTWKKAFDASTQLRKDNGLSGRAYGYDVDDNHKVTLALGIGDTTKANAFWKSDLVKQRRAEGGVDGEVKRFIYHVVKKY